MRKADRIADRLRNIVLDRYETEGITPTPEMANLIFFDLLGVYLRDGYEAAKDRAYNAMLQPYFINEMKNYPAR